MAPLTLFRVHPAGAIVRLRVQYPKDAHLTASREGAGLSFTLDGRRFFEVTITDRGVRVDSEATMGRRRYYYGEEVTLRFDRRSRPIVTAKGRPSKPIGFEEEIFDVQ